MKNSKVSIAVAVTLMLIPCIYLAKVYNALPQIVPTHFRMDGTPSDYNDKSVLALGILLMTSVGLGTFFLLRNIKRIDPKKTAQYNAGVFSKIGMAIIVLISILSIMVIQSTVDKRFDYTRILLPLLGIFFAFMGNLFYSIKPNYFVGLRLPWTLESEDNWRKTHQLAGKTMFAGGLLLAISSLLLGNHFPDYLLPVIIVTIVLIPSVYSFVEFKRTQQSKL